MDIPYRQRWLLRRTARALRRSDPHLAAMLVIFARLYAHEAIASAEQADPGWLRRALAWLNHGITAAAAWLVRALRRLARARPAVRREHPATYA